MTPSHISYRAALKSDAREMVDLHYAAVHAIGSDYYSSDVKLAWSPPPDAARQIASVAWMKRSEIRDIQTMKPRFQKSSL